MASDDAPRDAPRPRWLRPDLITAVSALVVGLCALGVSAYQAYVMRSQMRAAAWPHVELYHNYPGDAFSFWAQNNGVGPARVQTVLLTVDGRPVETWGAMLETLFADLLAQYQGPPPGFASVQSYISGRVLPRKKPSA